MIQELLACCFTLLTFLEATKVDGVVLSTFANVVGNQVIVRYLVPIFGVIPEPTNT